MEFRELSFEVRETDEDEGTFSGIANAFGVVDSYGSTFDPGSFKKTLSEQDNVPVVWFHSPTDPIGSAPALKETDEGLYVDGAELNLDVPKAKEVFSGMQFDPPYITEMSIGFETLQDETDDDGIEHKKEVKLYEISPLTKNFAANPEAQISEVRDSIVGLRRLNQAAEDNTKEELITTIKDMRDTLNGMLEDRADVRDTARTPKYSETTEDDWSRQTLGEYANQRGWDVDTVADMSDSQKSTAAGSSLLGRTGADNWSELTFFQVADGNGDLYKNALVAVKTGRGEGADIPESAYESAVSKVNQLLEEEFDVGEEDSIDQLLEKSSDILEDGIARLDGGSRETTSSEESPQGERDAGIDPHLVEELKRAGEKLTNEVN